jgi:hypothetical protein
VRHKKQTYGVAIMHKEILVWICKKSFTIFFVWLFLFVTVSAFPHKQVGDKQQPPRPVQEIKIDVVPEGLKVEWKEVPGATHYTIFWGNEPGNYTRLHDVSANAAIFTTLNQDKYVFAITAWNKKGESNFSPEVSIDLQEKRIVKK